MPGEAGTAGPVPHVAVVPSSGGALSAGVLVRALCARGLSAEVSSVERLRVEDAHDPHVARVVLVDADGEARQLEQTCTELRAAVPDARLLLLASEHSDDLARMVARGRADAVVGRTGGLDGLVPLLSAAARGRSRSRYRDPIPRQQDLSSRAVASLTEREREVLCLVATGATNSEVAGLLEISPHTVRTHIQNVLAKLGADNRFVAAAMARRAGLLPAGPDALQAYAGPSA